ncbi:MAG: DUF2116 family Zn-ribbon domain-containing protein [Azoarcus sp.]|jgi:predicted nucleic acid-binding Zn ribbon protein|nr:DUF2116 family Zn-ribbon domain-containing protein [Azoarcus sp.]
MADIIDLANATAEKIAADALHQRKPEGPMPTGVCLYCGEPLPDGRRWCDANCRDDWQKEQNMKRAKHAEIWET